MTIKLKKNCILFFFITTKNLKRTIAYIQNIIENYSIIKRELKYCIFLEILIKILNIIIGLLQVKIEYRDVIKLNFWVISKIKKVSYIYKNIEYTNIPKNNISIIKKLEHIVIRWLEFRKLFIFTLNYHIFK